MNILKNSISLIAITFATNSVFGIQDDPQLLTLIAGHETNLSQISTLEADFTDRPSRGPTVAAKWIKIGPREKYSRNVEYGGKNPASSFSEIFVDREQRIESRFNCSDKKNIKLINPGNQFGCSGIIAPLGRYQLTAPCWFRLLTRFHLYGQDDVLTLRELLSESQSVAWKKLSAHEYELTGERNIKIDNIVVKFRLILDASKGFLVTSAEYDRGEMNIFRGEILDFEIHQNLFFPKSANWSLLSDGKIEVTIESKLINVKINEPIDNDLVAIQFPKGLIVKEYKDETISSAGRFNTKPNFLIIGDDNQIEKRFKPEEINQLEELRKKYIDSVPEEYQSGGVYPNQPDPSGDLKVGSSIFDGSDWSFSRIAALVIMSVLVTSLCWMVYKFFYLFTVKLEHDKNPD